MAEKPSRPPIPQNPKKLVQELHHAPGIVGGIVEKGFSPSGDLQRKPSFPQPSVVPFPVARHRSHGPHWAPLAATVDDNEDGADGDRDGMDYEPVSSSFADPVKRRERKGLDFSRWRELVSNSGSNGGNSSSSSSNSTVRRPHKKQAIAAPEKEGEKKDLVLAASRGKLPPPEDIQEQATSVADDRTRERVSLHEIGEAHVPETHKKHVEDELSSKMAEQKADRVPDGQGSRSLVDDIDSENLARLEQMSSEEVEEARSEIMEKLDPSILEMLRKRGQSKMRSKRDSAPRQETLQKDVNNKKAVEDGGDSKARALARDMLSAAASSSSLWKSWSERVENIRTLRFSLEGDVVEVDFMKQQPNGNKPDTSQFKVENVAERDFLRTEGDPAAVGYTIKEAIALVRSLVPGQRTLALQLLSSIFNKALNNMRKDAGYVLGNTNSKELFVDWQAVWAFALGPESELALSLRIALDDNHDSVVLACAKAIQSILSYDVNEDFFNINEKLPTHDKDTCTAPVFRGKPIIDGAFLHGGFWKYNTKPSNIIPCNDEYEENEENNTIKDDVVVAGQDIAAGLVRMGILPRICYILEMDPLPTLEECLVSVLIALARHSPTCVNAIIRCPRLVQTVAKMEINPSRIKVVLLKVLCKSDKQICLDFVNCGVIQRAMLQWYGNTYTLDQWIKSGKEHCKLTSGLMVEQLRLWKVCIRYGYCITNFVDFFPAMCLWLAPPAFEKLIKNEVLHEFVAVTREAYLVLEALAQSLPSLHSNDQLGKQSTNHDDMEAWRWSHVIPMVDMAINWLSLKNIPYVSSIIGSQQNCARDSSLSYMLWVISAVLHMLAGVLDRIAPNNTDGTCHNVSSLPWLPEFVPKIGLEIIKKGFLNLVSGTESEEFPTKCGSLLEGLCYVRLQNDYEASLASVSCLHGIIRLVVSVDSSVQRARSANPVQLPKTYMSDTSDKILEEGIVKWSKDDLSRVFTLFISFLSSERRVLQSIEMFGRGGPAPGVGIGWGSAGGGYWSFRVLLAQVDAQCIVDLLEIFLGVLENDSAFVERMNTVKEGQSEGVATVNIINSALGVCLVAGPGVRATLENAFNVIFQAPILKYLSLCILYSFQSNKGLKPFDWQYEEDDYLFFSEVLSSHYKSRWLSAKHKSSSEVARGNQDHAITNKGNALETIHEDSEVSEMVVKHPDCNSLLTEWAHQRLPLPLHWFLSSICSINAMKSSSIQVSSNTLDVAKSGLFFVLGLEAMSSLPLSGSQDSPISAVPLVWKLHALSMALHSNMEVLEDQRSRSVFESLQELYGQHLDKLRRDTVALPDKNQKVMSSSVALSNTQDSGGLAILGFQAQVNGSYITFVEGLIEQFAATSYGDIIYGRQITLYLHLSVEAELRLATWKVLTNAHVLDLLPPLERCLAEDEGYLEPVEHDEGILEAYVKSWTTGSLDKAAARGSVGFTLAMHHLSCFIFGTLTSDEWSLCIKLVKPLLRSYSQRKQQEGMMLDLVRYKLPVSHESRSTEIERRIELLKQACEGNASLLSIVEKLKSSVYN